MTDGNAETSLEKNCGIEVSQVVNGFIVMRGNSFVRNGRPSGDETMVFRTMAELETFIRDHFSHRARTIEDDPS